MIAVLYLVKLIYPIDSIGRFGALIECFVYGIIGSLVYIFLLVKTGLFKDLFGNSRLLKKFKLVR